MTKSKNKPLKFEQAIEQLEEIVEQIESGEVGLEECLERYERGMELKAQCEKILAAAQKKIATLTADDKGGLTVEGDVDNLDSDADEDVEE